MHPTAVGKQVSKEERYVLPVCPTPGPLAHTPRLNREQRKLVQTTLVYGEIQFESFGIAIEKVHHRAAWGDAHARSAATYRRRPAP